MIENKQMLHYGYEDNRNKKICAKESSNFSLELGDWRRLIFSHTDFNHVFGSYLRNLYELYHFLFVAYTLVLTMSKSFIMLL